MDRKRVVEEAAKKGVDMSWLQEEQPQQPDISQLSPMAGKLLTQPQQLGGYSPKAAQMLDMAQKMQQQQPVYMPFAPGTPTQAEKDRRAAEEQEARAKELQALFDQHELDKVERTTQAIKDKIAEQKVPQPSPTDRTVLTEPQQIGNFNTSEFACKGTGQIKVSSELIHRLNQLRDYLGVPVIVNSGYRTPEYNRQVNGAPESRHLTGEAADIVAQGVSIQELARAAEKFFGDGGIGTYRGHVHVDVGPQRRW